jgi:carboxyl-terminal processing protease
LRPCYEQEKDVKRRASDAHRWFGLLILLYIFSVALAAPEAPKVPAAASVPAPGAPGAGAAADEKTQLARLRSDGLGHALAGRFADALGDLKSAVKLSSDDAAVNTAVKLIEDYQARMKQAKADREAEYRQTVQRIDRAKLAQEYAAKTDAAALREKLRKQIMEVMVPAFSKSGTSDSLETGDPNEAVKAARKVQGNSTKALTDALSALRVAEDMVKEDASTFGQTLRGVLKALNERMQRYLDAWKSVDLETPASRHQAGRKLKAQENDLADSLGDVEGMIVEKPWRIILAQARLAKELAEDKDKFVQEKWYQDLMTDMEARGQRAIKDANWSDALSIYAVLEDLDDNNQSYKDLVKATERHVRVLGLYGKKTGDLKGASTKPSTEPSTTPVDDEPTWQKRVEGVDARMVEAAIGQLAQNYVTTVDWRKVTRGALLAIKVLAETPQAAYSFKALDDAKRKGELLAAIDRELTAVEKADRLDSDALLHALNGVLEASEKTVEIPTEVLCVEFTDGFLNELDKFSAMVWPHDVAEFEKSTMGHFYGVGIQISKEPGEPLKVVEPLPDTPAFKAGLKAGDLVLSVDGRRTEDISLERLVNLIQGPKGTKVTLQIKRSGLPQPLEVPLVRDQINIRTLKGWKRISEEEGKGGWNFLVDPDNKIAYLRLTQFTEQTVPEVEEALKNLTRSGIHSLVLDLRFNPGGLLRSATGMADEFLKAGRIVSTSGRQLRESVIDATPTGDYQDGDLVVLVNQYSASAAEILSGAIKDWRRGLIVGQRTYGKGSVQNVIPIRQGRARLKLTTQYYYLPSGRLLHRRNGDKVWGVDPDVPVFMTPKQTKQWLELRRKTDLLQDVAPSLLKADLAEQFSSDIQLETAALMLKLMKLQKNEPVDVRVAGRISEN